MAVAAEEARRFTINDKTLNNEIEMKHLGWKREGMEG